MAGSATGERLPAASAASDSKMNVVLGNADYARHMTDEGDQFQRGLEHAGWAVAGFGFQKSGQFNSTSIPQILEKYAPSIVVVSDPRDWDKTSSGCFDPRCSFDMIEALADYPCFKAVVYKDAATAVGFQRDFARKIKADALVTYYHEKSVHNAASWTKELELIRTYHSVEPRHVKGFQLARRRGLISGALGPCYPLRERIAAAHELLRIIYLPHPGYHNAGSCTEDYLSYLQSFKINIATCSTHEFALRKIFESVCCGCICLTDLPDYDQLPVIDNWIIRVPNHTSIALLNNILSLAEQQWDPSVSKDRAEKAKAFYDWRALGERLSGLLVAASTKKAP